MANGFMTPAEAAYGIQQARPQFDTLLSDMMAASTQYGLAAAGPQIIPGTGGLTSEGLLQKEVAAKEAQDRAQEVATSANLFPALNQAAADIAALAGEESVLIRKINENSKVEGFFASLGAAWENLKYKERLATIEESKTARSNTAQALNTLTQQSAQTAKAVSTAVTADTIANMRQALASYNMQAEASNRFKAAQMGVESINASLNMDDRKLKLYQAQRTMELQERSEARAQAQFELSMERERRLNEQAEIQLKAVQESQEADDFTYQLYSIGAIETGQEPVPKGPKFNAFVKLAGDSVKPLIARGLKVLQSPVDPATGVRMPIPHGPTIAEREDFWEKTGVTPNTPQAERAVRMQYDAKISAQKVAGSTDKNVIAATAEKVLKNNFEAEQNDIRPGSMMEAPAYEVFEKSTLGASPIWNQIIKPVYTAANASKSAVDPQLVFDALYQASARDKKITTTQAAEFYSNLFTQATALNNSIHKFKAWTGMEQNKFGVSLKVGTRSVAEMALAPVAAEALPGYRIMRGTINLNAANMAEVQAALGMRIAYEIGSELNLSGEVSPTYKGFYNQPLLRSAVVVDREINK